MRRAPLTALLALGLCLLAAPAAGAATINGHAVPQSSDAIRGYWTPERMAAAQPLDGPQGGTEPASPTASAAAQPPDLETDPAQNRTYPQQVHGRLFVTFGGEDRSCSATVVHSFSGNLVLSAGHCIVKPSVAGPEWAANVAFVPSYREGERPYGTWPAISLRAPGAWARAGLLDFDLGAVNIIASDFGQFQDLLGARGITFNRTARSYRNKRFQIFGYPTDPVASYDGERLIVCNSRFRGIEKLTGALKAGPCHQQEGSSGGGWVLNDRLLNSVVSHSGCITDSDACDVLSGTYFGDVAFKLWNSAAGRLPRGRVKAAKACKKRKGRKARNCLVKARTFKPIVRTLELPGV